MLHLIINERVYEKETRTRNEIDNGKKLLCISMDEDNWPTRRHNGRCWARGALYYILMEDIPSSSCKISPQEVVNKL